ncbi:MAG TPA: flagellar export protein FliJ [Methylococcaceae bacterium]|nr:flagellar export protein FliJ [Methylococcaceae bacterium]
MKRSKRLQVIVDIKASQEKKALEMLGRSQRQHTQMKGQVEGLSSYRSDYVDKCNAFAKDGVKVSRLIEFRSFIDKLDIAISGQEKILKNMEQDVFLKRQTWEAMYQRTQTIQKVRESALKVEQHHENKREQREQDEHASRLGYKKYTAT